MSVISKRLKRVSNIKKILFFLFIVFLSFTFVYYKNTFNESDFLQEITKNENIKSDFITFLSSSDNMLAVGRESGEIELYNSKTVFSPHVIKAHNQRVSNIIFSDDEKNMITISQIDKKLKIWDTKSGDLLLTLNGYHADAVMMNNNSTLFVSESDNFYIYDMDKNTLSSDQKNTTGVINSFVISPDQKYLAIGTVAHVELWKIKDERGEIDVEHLRDFSKPAYESSEWIVDLKFSDDNSALLVVSRFGKISILDTSTFQELKFIQTDVNNVSDSLIIGENFDSVILFGTTVTSQHNGEVKQINPITGDIWRIGSKFTNMPKATYFPDSQKILVGNIHKFYSIDYKKR